MTPGPDPSDDVGHDINDLLFKDDPETQTDGGDAGDTQTVIVAGGVDEMKAALHEVAAAQVEAATKISSLSDALLADQQDARDREARRFRTVYAVLCVVAALSIIVIALFISESNTRAERYTVSEGQRVCSDEITKGLMGSLGSWAVAPRYQVDGNDDPVIGDDGQAVPLTYSQLLAQNERLRHGVRDALTALNDLPSRCYGPAGPDRTPLDGDPTR